MGLNQIPSALIKMKVNGKRQAPLGASEGYLCVYVPLCVCMLEKNLT